MGQDNTAKNKDLKEESEDNSHIQAQIRKLLSEEKDDETSTEDEPTGSDQDREDVIENINNESELDEAASKKKKKHSMKKEEEDEDEDEDDDDDDDDKDDDDDDDKDDDEDDDDEEEKEESKNKKSMKKEEMIEDLVGHLDEMKEEEVEKLYDLINDPIRQTAAKQSVSEEAKDSDETISKLVEQQEDLSEDFKSKAATIFEAAVSEKVAKENERLREEYSQVVEEEVQKHYDSMVEKVDTYLSFVVEEWIEDNQEAVDKKIRTEISESFMSSLKNLFEEHYIEMPESKTDLYKEMAKKADSLEEKVEEQSAVIDTLTEKVKTHERNRILQESTEGLYASQADRLRKLVETIEFTSPEEFEEKVKVIKDSFLGENHEKKESRKSTSRKDESVNNDIMNPKGTTTIEEDTDETGEEKEDPEMGLYMKAVSRMVHNTNKYTN